MIPITYIALHDRQCSAVDYRSFGQNWSYREIDEIIMVAQLAVLTSPWRCLYLFMKIISIAPYWKVIYELASHSTIICSPNADAGSNCNRHWDRSCNVDSSRRPRTQRAAAAAVSRLTLEDIPFNGSRAYEFLKQLCVIGPRPSGSPGMEVQQKMLAEHFKNWEGRWSFNGFE